MVSIENRRLRLKAQITGSTPHYIQKVISYRAELYDAFKPHFRSFIDVFIPKLTPEFVTPSIMLYVRNGNGRCLIRSKNPLELALELEKIAAIIKSNLWADIWLNLEGTSNDLITGLYDSPNTHPLVVDNKLIDLK